MTKEEKNILFIEARRSYERNLEDVAAGKNAEWSAGRFTGLYLVICNIGLAEEFEKYVNSHKQEKKKEARKKYRL